MDESFVGCGGETRQKLKHGVDSSVAKRLYAESQNNIVNSPSGLGKWRLPTTLDSVSVRYVEGRSQFGVS